LRPAGRDAPLIATPMFDFDRFDAVPLQDDPCSFLVVPGFVRPEAMARINADYPAIVEPGNFPLDGLAYGPGFQAFVAELTGLEMRRHFAAKFGMELDGYPTQMTIRRFASSDDGHIHNDSVTKKITILIYLNPMWDQAGGRLRILRSERDIDDYAVEVEPSGGTLLAFRRNERSFHGFKPCSGERRTLQMYWVDPKRNSRGAKAKRGRVAKFFKRLMRPTK
jgi:SM-20-related protein